MHTTLLSARFPNNHYRTCDFTKQISVLVGPDEQTFFVHKDMICARSRFFKAACSERWVEGKEKRVELPDVEASLFHCYIARVYGGKVDVERFANEGIEKLPGKDDRLVAKLLELYILGDALDDIHLRNRVLQILVLETTVLPHAETVKRVWEKTPEHSSIRKMIVRRAVLRTDRADLMEDLKNFTADFVLQVAVSLLGLVPAKEKKSFEEELHTWNRRRRRRIDTDDERQGNPQ